MGESGRPEIVPDMANAPDNASETEHGLPAAIMDAARMRLAKLPLVTHALEIAGRDWPVVAVADQSALTAVSDDLEHFPFGLMLWDAAPVLAAELPRHIKNGQTMLELGAGVGLAGLVARALGAEVVQTDHSAEALALCARNAEINGLSGVALALADWLSWNSDRRFDLIVGSDILYDADLHAPVLAVLERSLAPGGRVLLSDPGRSTTPAFVSMLEKAGWIVDRRRRRVPSLARPSS